MGRSSNGEFIGFSYSNDVCTILSRVNTVPLPPCVGRGLGSGRECRAICDGRLNSTTTPATNLRFAPRVLSRVEGSNIGATCMALRINLKAFHPIGISSIAGRGVRARRCVVPRGATSVVGRAGGGNNEMVYINAASYHAIRSITAGGNYIYTSRSSASVFVCPNCRFGYVSTLVAGFRLPRDALVVLISTFTNFSGVVGTCGATITRGCEFFDFNSTVFVRSWVVGFRMVGRSYNTEHNVFRAIRNAIRAPTFVGITATTTVGNNLSTGSLGKVNARIVLYGACRLRIHPNSSVICSVNNLRGFAK